MGLLDKLKKAFTNAHEAVNNFTMKTANSIMEGVTAGHWQGKDNYTGWGSNPAPTANNLYDNAVEKLEEEGEGAPEIPQSGGTTVEPSEGTTVEPSEGTTVEPSEGTTVEPSGGIVDKTDENIEIPNYYGDNNVFNWIEEQQQRIWDREDTIRRETQAREDTAYSRAIRDLQRAGVNVNLMGSITPAASGGGITNASTKTYEVYELEMEKYLKELELIFDASFTGNENDKDRAVEIIGKLLQFFGIQSIANSKK